MDILNINSVIPSGKYKGKTVEEILSENKKLIFELLKQGLYFDDEVLSLAGIKKSISNVRVTHVFTEHEKDKKKYEKETASLSKILKEIRTIDNIPDVEPTDGVEQITPNVGNEYDEIDIDNI